MANVSSIRPWFKEDLRLVLLAIYFAMRTAGWRRNADEWRGSLDALAALAKAWGVGAAEFMNEADVRLIGGCDG